MLITTLLAAEAHERLGNPFEYIYENRDRAFYVCHNEPQSKLRMVRKVASFVSAKAHDAGSGIHNGMVVYSYVSKDGKMAIYSAHVDLYTQPHSSIFNASFSFLKLLHPPKTTPSSDSSTSTADSSTSNTTTTTTADANSNTNTNTNTTESSSTSIKALMDCEPVKLE